ncbi:hypothetical protein BLA29_015035 [Euroglyphus maynei]|uniref:Uncharacterized protein n=1 Tax=Euroglyphus maynei TaxID=6958 RepID=A0A1Y3B8U9_EURMA|nr:hypothetical protein BLA29_015035 [Euroglyphus maynei]
MAIQKRKVSKENNFDDMIKNLEAKYAKGKAGKSSSSTTTTTKNKKRRN